VKLDLYAARIFSSRFTAIHGAVDEIPGRRLPGKRLVAAEWSAKYRGAAMVGSRNSSCREMV